MASSSCLPYGGWLTTYFSILAAIPSMEGFAAKWAGKTISIHQPLKNALHTSCWLTPGYPSSTLPFGTNVLASRLYRAVGSVGGVGFTSLATILHLSAAADKPIQGPGPVEQFQGRGPDNQFTFAESGGLLAFWLSSGRRGPMFLAVRGKKKRMETQPKRERERGTWRPFECSPARPLH